MAATAATHPRHPLDVVALGAGHDVLLRVGIGRDLHTDGVVALVQTKHRCCHAALGDRQRVAIRAQAEPHAVTGEVEPP